MTLEAQMLWDSLDDSSKLAAFARASAERDRLRLILLALNDNLDFETGVPENGVMQIAFPEMLRSTFELANEAIQ